MNPTIAVFVAAAVTAVVISWAFRRIGHLMAADYYGRLFVNAAKPFLNDPTIPEEPKCEIREFAPYIANRHVAASLSRAIEHRKDDWLRDANMVEAFGALEGDKREQFMRVLYFFFFALSYQDDRRGWRIRRKLTTDSRRAVVVYARSADRFISGDDVPEGAAA